MTKSGESARSHVRRLFAKGNSWTLRQLTDNGRFSEGTIKQYICDLKNPKYSGGPLLIIQRDGDTYYLGESSPTINMVSSPSKITRNYIDYPVAEQTDYDCVLQRLLARLDRWDLNWRERVDETAMTDQRKRRLEGDPFTNCEVMEAACLSIFSAQVDWRRIQELKEDLRTEFQDYDAALLAGWGDAKIDEVRRWFLSRRAGSQKLKRNLLFIREAAKQFNQMIEDGERLDDYFSRKCAEFGHDPIGLAVCLAQPGKMKIRGMGVPLASEFLRNLGYDLAKPDIHILRAAGCFGMIQFRRWIDRSARRKPAASLVELINTMRAMERFAQSVGESTTHLDSIIWTACSKGGAWLTNQELTEIGGARSA